MIPPTTAAQAFQIDGCVANVRAYGQGRINDSFLVEVEAGPLCRLILQRVNRRVFPAPERIMKNLRRLEQHLQQQTSAANQLQLPRIIQTRSGSDWWLDETGGFWRAMTFIECSRNLERLRSPAQAEQVGTVLGRFHRLTHDLPTADLVDTLPGFHIAPSYLSDLDRTLSRNRPRAPDAELAAALSAVDTRRDLVHRLEDARLQGLLPLRPIHGDPKLDNILFHEQNDQALSLIDLDTVKPGLVHYDLGDCLRSCCNTAGEAASRPTFDLDICQGILKGYLSQVRPFFRDTEYGLIYDCIRLLPFELGLRFLTDHLEGDLYFKTTHRGQNLGRALTQFRLTELIEAKERKIRSLIEESRA